MNAKLYLKKTNKNLKNIEKTIIEQEKWYYKNTFFVLHSIKNE